ncbi:hypothetical protein D3C83_10900 [compost metagenome]
MPPARIVLHHDLGADDVRGHEVRRELDAGEFQVQRVGERLHQQRLAQARHAFEQHVAGREQAREYPVHEIVMAYDAPLDLAPECFQALACERHARLVAERYARFLFHCVPPGSPGAPRAPRLRVRKYRRMNSL